MFQIIETHDGVQTAMMVLECGQESGPYGNEHATSTQVLVVIKGSIEARIDSRTLTLTAGDSAIIGKNAQHQLIGRSTGPATILNVYYPPAYDAGGERPVKYRRDRSGEIYQNAFTENDGAVRERIAKAQHFVPSVGD